MIESWKEDKLLTGFSNHFMNEANSTLPYFPPLMYIFMMANSHQNILEIGIERGYAAYYFAYAAKMNGGMYYGIDINPESCEKIDKELTKADLPHKIICADTKKIEKIDFMDKIDFAFLDGEHTTEAIDHEIELIYPLLNSGGWGYIFIHDIIDMGNAGAWLKLKGDKRFETLGLNPNYGLGIARKMEGVDYEDTAKKFEVKTTVAPRYETLKDLINRNKYKNIVEIGVNGDETIEYLLEHCDLNQYTLVDVSPNQLKEKKTDGKFVKISQTTSFEVSKEYEDESLDLVYIDGSAQFDSVCEDISVWRPKIRKGGMICGHDYLRLEDTEKSQVKSAVTKMIGFVNLISDETSGGDRCVWWQYINN